MSGCLSAFFHDASIKQMNLPVRVPGEARVVRDHADRRAFAVQLAQQLHHGVAIL